MDETLNSKGQTYEQYMKEVDVYIAGLVGVTSSDLEDFCTMDYFLDEVSANVCAYDLLRASDLSFMIPPDLLESLL